MTLVLTIIVVLSWLVKKNLQGKIVKGKDLEIVSGVQLGLRERIVLLKAHQHSVLVSHAGGEIRMLLLPPNDFEKTFEQAMKGE